MKKKRGDGDGGAAEGGATTSIGAAASPCVHLRATYQQCFDKWYSEKFSKGHWDKEECITEWHNYRACLSQHLEDKHLRRILLEPEASPYLNKDDVTTSTKDRAFDC